MRHWKSFLNKEKDSFTDKIYPEEARADIIVVIPCFNEPDIFTTLNSIKNCYRVESHILIAVIVNSSESSAIEAKHLNRNTHEELMKYSSEFNDDRLTLTSVLCEDLPKKHAGVGLARRIGMNLAIQHFLVQNKKNGVIVSLDADCTVSENFFTSILESYQNNENLIATIHNVIHRVDGGDVELESAVRQYETYIKCYSRGLENIGFPYYYPTIGSAFSVTADAYVKVGGMGRQQGGEDFYFLQKIFQQGEVEFIENITVFPLARFSDRVPFGTGPALQRINDESDSVLKVYSMQSFKELKCLFDIKHLFYKKDQRCVTDLINGLHPAVKDFIRDFGVIDKINDCNRNSATIDTFEKRFFHHFNAFLIIKYMNYVHPKYFELENIVTLAHRLGVSI